MPCPLKTVVRKSFATADLSLCRIVFLSIRESPRDVATGPVRDTQDNVAGRGCPLRVMTYHWPRIYRCLGMTTNNFEFMGRIGAVHLPEGRPAGPEAGFAVAFARNPRSPRRGGRAVECTSLENWRPLTRTVGSNPTPSASYLRYQLVDSNPRSIQQ